MIAEPREEECNHDVENEPGQEYVVVELPFQPASDASANAIQACQACDRQVLAIHAGQRAAEKERQCGTEHKGNNGNEDQLLWFLGDCADPSCRGSRIGRNSMFVDF